jgi:hypothetical protein
VGLLEAEIGAGPADNQLRRQVLAAIAETGYWQGMRQPPSAEAASDERGVGGQTWPELLEVLRDAILDDADHELADELLDLEPRTAAAVKQLLAIDRDYFVTVPEDPSPARLQELHCELLGLLGGPEGEP